MKISKRNIITIFIALGIFIDMLTPAIVKRLPSKEQTAMDIMVEQENKRVAELRKIDPECEAPTKDSVFASYCYLKKAIETEDGLYCLGSYDKSGCLNYLAAKTKDPKYCDLTMPSVKNGCLSKIEYSNREEKFHNIYLSASCNDFQELERKTKCEQLYGTFFESLKTHS